VSDGHETGTRIPELLPEIIEAVAPAIIQGVSKWAAAYLIKQRFDAIERRLETMERSRAARRALLRPCALRRSPRGHRRRLRQGASRRRSADPPPRTSPRGDPQGLAVKQIGFPARSLATIAGTGRLAQHTSEVHRACTS